MILQIQSTETSQPKVSLDQLAEVPFLSTYRKCEILYHAKFPTPRGVGYYDCARQGMLRAFHRGLFSTTRLAREYHAIGTTPARGVLAAARRDHNAEAVRSLLALGASAHPPKGTHRIVRRDAMIPLRGVMVSARPDIITENAQDGWFAFTKLRISRGPNSADAQEIMLLALLHYGQQQSHRNLAFRIERTRLIDCFSRQVLAGHAIGRHRYQQLHHALSEIASLWPQIRKRASGE